MRAVLALIGLIVTLTLPTLLAGCANHPVDCAVGFSHGDCLPGTAGYRANVSRDSADDNTCRAYGLKFGSTEYAQCRQNIANQRSAESRIALSAYLASRNQPAPPPYVMPTVTPRTTNCSRMGTQINCQTW
jgi:hypothetical protein